MTDSGRELSQLLLMRHALPMKARVDAIHIALAATNSIDYVLTWNCKHIANATLRSKIEASCREAGYNPPILCTPFELLEVLE
ncbi:MAG TPA: hypothetical protein PLD59_02920 [Tepidisphaeraceae bacterium]|nr:hypothetical protein [Tepidisphaeraceae bacterium]